jgi:hypothetical protein
MDFVDGFNYTQTQLNLNIRNSFIKYIKKIIKNNDSLLIDSTKLIEQGLNGLGLKSFDFVNDKNIEKIEKAIAYNFNYFCEIKAINAYNAKVNQIIDYIENKNLNYLNLNENNNGFLKALQLKLTIAKIYEIDKNFNQILEISIANVVVKSSNRIIKIKLNDEVEVKVLILMTSVNLDSLKSAAKKFDYSEIAQFIGVYNLNKKGVDLVATNEIDEKEMLTKTFIKINLNKNIKEKFK